ncbi:hypothetical protein [Antrihabitans cavernicola]|uniref:WXG100 family type VII secretion target n=1 Tax=Antrihabitans cavernicola TaxID=2495913 RepID=A0A5A7SG22_9NOCA|nr:hypothetical protein [Spelaeibacter cavernicola]KAA0024524.1 hypothetical protein FOY51_00735 [Spelaeibacter cavernicola]
MSTSWVGGDIVGLQAMALTMSGAPEKMKDIVRILGARSDKLAADAGWSGGAADEFRKKWSMNSIQVGALAESVAAVGAIVGTLGNNLAEVEANLYNAADAARSNGVPIGPRGEPLPIVTSGTPGDSAAATLREEQAKYVAIYNEAMHLADGLRLKAGDDLSAVFGKIDSHPDNDEGPSVDKWTTVGSYITGLYSVPANENLKAEGTLPASIDDAENTFRDARRHLDAAKADYAERGMRLPAANDARLAHIAAHQNLVNLRESLAAAEAGKGEGPGARLFATKFDDLLTKSPTGAMYSAAMPESLKFMKEIPVLDVVASAVGAEFQSHDDMEKGWSPEHARAANYSSGAVGVITGAAIGAEAATGLTEGGPVLLPAAGAGLAAVYVGEFSNALWHEHWQQDLGEHGGTQGIVAGVGNATATAGKNSLETITDVGKAIWGAMTKK